MRVFVLLHFILSFHSLNAFQNKAGIADLSLDVITQDGIWKLKVVNHSLAPMDLYLQDSKTKTEVKSYVIPPKDTLISFELGEGDKQQVIDVFNENYDLGYYLGDPNAIHDSTYLYGLPFKKGKKYSVSQGFNGRFSHNKSTSRYAIDFQLEIGEPVHAAREGLVIKVEEQFNEHGGEEYRNKANRIIILHSDGTTASYVHLDFEGAAVEEGEYVQKGQHIGNSGFTGFTRGPHLHFVVRKGKDVAVPIYFEGYEGVSLKKRKRYKRTK
ncbi:M23 family metallopeptidase [Ekhidna sp.]|uniref:M23 family metallopeptidase n=1 Tax=Ekhidna sp. TaxID=2608089 RepID=UPI003CCB7A17